MRTLTRQELTAALAARQGLLERHRLAPSEAISRLTPLQGQHPPAPYIALAARLEGFARGDLEAAIDSRSVVKTSLLRLTLHLAAAGEYPAYAQLARQARMRIWRSTYPQLDEARVTAELGAWLTEPRKAVARASSRYSMPGLSPEMSNFAALRAVARPAIGTHRVAR